MIHCYKNERITERLYRKITAEKITVYKKGNYKNLHQATQNPSTSVPYNAWKYDRFINKTSALNHTFIWMVYKIYMTVSQE